MEWERSYGTAPHDGKSRQILPGKQQGDRGHSQLPTSDSFVVYPTDPEQLNRFHLSLFSLDMLHLIL